MVTRGGGGSIFLNKKGTQFSFFLSPQTCPRPLGRVWEWSAWVGPCWGIVNSPGCPEM